MTGTFTAAGAPRHRYIEDGLAILGGLVMAAYVLGVEVFPPVCYSLGRCVNKPDAHPFPWGVVFLVSACVLPKTVGRLTAGRVWQAIGNAIPGRRDGGNGPPPPAEAA